MEQKLARVEVVTRLYEYALLNYAEPGEVVTRDTWRRVFEAYDRDADGMLTPDEFGLWLGDSFGGLSVVERARHVKDLMDDAGWSNTTPISIEQLMKALQGVTGSDVTQEEALQRVDLIRRAAAGENVDVEWAALGEKNRGKSSDGAMVALIVGGAVLLLLGGRR